VALRQLIALNQWKTNLGTPQPRAENKQFREVRFKCYEPIVPPTLRINVHGDSIYVEVHEFSGESLRSGRYLESDF
jgi:hypothetical protein